ncbi:MAG: ATP synthase F1 subunit epsilon [Bdellovibrionaceae bacterium]|nr:ATP synthase F1 subunit epsilon [Pseudobdellovibrionaceae bacterium]|tara:strand:- start:1142 stop:1546 length:405 start_codon:yes stop_codon:yes gene_type:complete
MFTLNLVTPEKKMVTDQEVEEVIAPGSEGQMDIFPGHAPLVGTMMTGVLKYRLKDSSTYTPVVVSWGYIAVHPDGVSILAETAESVEEIDRKRAEEAAEKARKNLVDPYIDGDQIEKFQRKLNRANARLDALNN